MARLAPLGVQLLTALLSTAGVSDALPAPDTPEWAELVWVGLSG
jgi:hypothetical protein